MKNVILNATLASLAMCLLTQIILMLFVAEQPHKPVCIKVSLEINIPQVADNCFDQLIEQVSKSVIQKFQEAQSLEELSDSNGYSTLETETFNKKFQQRIEASRLEKKRIAMMQEEAEKSHQAEHTAFQADIASYLEESSKLFVEILTLQNQPEPEVVVDYEEEFSKKGVLMPGGGQIYGHALFPKSAVEALKELPNHGFESTRAHMSEFVQEEEAKATMLAATPIPVAKHIESDELMKINSVPSLPKVFDGKTIPASFVRKNPNGEDLTMKLSIPIPSTPAPSSVPSESLIPTYPKDEEEEVKDEETKDPQVFYSIPEGTDLVSRKRDPFLMEMWEVRRMLHDPKFLNKDAITGVRPEVVRAQEILLEQLAIWIPTEKRFSPEQICAIGVCESKYWGNTSHYDPKGNPDGEIVYNLNTRGDLGFSGDEQAYGFLQLRGEAFNEVLKDTDLRMPFSDKVRKELRALGIRGYDFHGNVLLSYLVFEFWHYRYTQDKTFFDKSGSYNAGPSGFKRGNGHRYARMAEVFLQEINKRVAAQDEAEKSDEFSFQEDKFHNDIPASLYQEDRDV